MEDKTIFEGKAGFVEEKIIFLSNCVKDVCDSGDDISKYKKIIRKYFPDEPELFTQLEELFGMIREQKSKQKLLCGDKRTKEC